MQTNPFGDRGFTTSRLGFGAMRLPTVELDGKRVIDEDEAIRMIRRAIDSGVTYVDTAYGYHDGQSELVVGKALADGYRERVTLVTKLPQWAVNEPADMDRLLNEQLKKLNTDHIDIYLLHAMNSGAFEKLRGMDYASFLDRAKADGRIRFAGFSFHDDAETFLRILSDYPWDAAQVQLNYLDDDTQATVEGVRRAGEMGIPIIVMEPLRGGALANPPETVRALIDAYTPRRTPVEWAFRYVTSFPEVKVVLSGMSTMEQVEDNLRIFSGETVTDCSDQDAAFFKALKKAYLDRMPIRCTQCRYCVPCPSDVRIPVIFKAYDNAHMLGQIGHFTERYSSIIRDGFDASKCVRCGQCEPACPQNIHIIDWLARVHQEHLDMAK